MKDPTPAAGTVFEFGRNWARFVDRHLDDEAVDHAVRSLGELLGTHDLSGRSFVDVGCGSGLSSLAALRLGASPIVSFDVDRESVQCCRYLRQREGEPRHWEVREGSVLDEALPGELGTFDIVYSWGVLHHTGAMWRALDQVCRLVGERGVLAIAIYNRAEALGLYPDGRFGPSRLWVPLKRLYCSLPTGLQTVIDFKAVALYWVVCLLRLRNPLRAVREYRRQRGMALRTDIKDWLGGYPYEYAAPDELLRFLKPRRLALDNLIYHGGLRCNEYVFRRLP